LNRIANLNGIYSFILFLISPLLSVVAAIVNYRSGWAKNIIWLFTVFYSVTMVVIEGRDINRYIERFLDMVYSNLDWKDFQSILYQDHTTVDIFQPLVTFLVAQFTSDYRVLFAVFGLIFGYFFSRNIWYLLKYAGPRIGLFGALLIICFVLINPFWNINGFRFWTATHVFFFGAIHYLMEGKKSYLFFVLLTPLIHFTFIFPIGLLLLQVVAGNRIPLFYFFYLGTMFLSSINVEAISDQISSLPFLPDVIRHRVMSYANEEYAEQRAETAAQTSWFVRIYTGALFWSITAMLSLIYLRGRSFLKEVPGLANVFCFALLLLGVTNLLTSIPSVGRFIYVGGLFAVAVIFWYLQHGPSDKLTYYAVVLTVPLLLFYCLIIVRIGMDSIGLFALVGNPLITGIVEHNTPLIDLIK